VLLEIFGSEKAYTLMLLEISGSEKAKPTCWRLIESEKAVGRRRTLELGWNNP
jgi:hypothetical protein